MIERSIGNREVLMLSEQRMVQIHGMECYDESYAAAYMAAMASKYPAILEAYTVEGAIAPSTNMQQRRG
jgi:hypothetical protein